MTDIVLSSVADTMIYKAAAQNNYGVTTSSIAGKGADVFRALIRFDTSSIPTGSIISSAILSLYFYAQGDASDQNVSAHRALTQWYEGDKAGAAAGDTVDSSTWALRNNKGSVAWGGGAGGAAGSDFATDATDTTLIANADYKFYDFDVLADVNAWHAGTANNYGWWIIGTETGTTMPYKRYYTREWADDTTKRPKLTVTYTSGGSTPIVHRLSLLGVGR